MENESTMISSSDQEPEVEQIPLVGRTNRFIYSLTLLASLAVVAVLFVFIARGSIALAASLPGTFNIKATTLTGTGFDLTPAIAPNGQPVAVNTLATATITNQVITKTISVFGHTVTVTISAGGGSGGPATASNLVTDISGQSSDSATLTNLQLSDKNVGIDIVEQTADTATLTNVSIDSPFLSASSITLPNLSIALSIS